MKTIDSREAFYPAFHLGCEPRAIPCTLSIVEVEHTDRVEPGLITPTSRYVKTPFAMLNAVPGDDLAKYTRPTWGYYASAEECDAYLQAEYPHWQEAAPIMDAWCESRRLYGGLVGDGHIADRLGTTRDDVARVARGHRTVSLKTIRKLVKAIA